MRQSVQPWPSALFVLCCGLLLLPLWTTRFLPMVDLPQYAGLLSIFIRFDDPRFGYAEIFSLNFFTPYLLGFGLARLLSLVFSVSMALRLLVSIAVLAVPVVCRELNREVGGRVEWDFLGFPIALSFTFGWGMVNYLFGIPLALWFILLSLRYSAAPTRGKGLALAALAVGLFWLHVMIMAFSCLIGATIVVLRSPGLKRALLRSLPYFSPAPFFIAWVLRTQATESQVSGTVLGWRLHRVLMLPVHVMGAAAESLRDSRAVPCLLGGLCVLALPFLTGAVPARKAWRWTPLVICLGLYLLTPHWIFGTAQLFPRFAVFVVPLLLLAVRPTDGGLGRVKALRALPAVFAIGWLLYTLFLFWAFDRQNWDFRRALEHADENKAVLALIFDRNSAYFAGPQYLHFPSWYEVEKGGYVEFSFAMFFQEIVRFRSDRDRIPIGFEWAPQTFDWDRHGGDRFDLFFVRAPLDVGPLIFAGRPVRLGFRSGNWWIYERIPARATKRRDRILSQTPPA